MSDHADTLFENYIRELAAEVGLRGEALTRKLQRFREGCTQHRNTTEDWNGIHFNCLDEAQKELDDCWLYLAKALQANNPHPQIQSVMELVLLAGRLLTSPAQGADQGTQNTGEKGDATSATVADGQPVNSTMGVEG